MAKLISLLKRIVGRIKKMAKSEYFMIVGMMAVPTGTIIFLGYDNLTFVGCGFLITGLLAWLMGIFALRSEEKQRQNDRKVTNNIVSTLIDELKGIRTDIKNLSGKSKGDNDDTRV